MVRIGVTGHRFLAEIPKLQAGIDQVLTRIAGAYPDETWSVISSLAEGADQLVVQRVFIARQDARLVVPLPLPACDYRWDFSTGQSRAEFEILLARAVEVIPPPKNVARNEGYWLSGKTMLGRSDVLVALWDGQNALGQGGTGEIVMIARQRRLPIAWVHCDNRSAGIEEQTSLGLENGKVSFEGLQHTE
jgi:hypothetical protein